MNILFVHEADYVDKVVFEYQVIPEVLSSKGHKVIVIDFPVSWKKKHIFDLGSFRTEYRYNIKKTKKRRGVTLIRPGIIKIRAIDRLIAFMSYFLIIRKAIIEYKIDAIVLLAAPNNGLQTLFWAKRFKIPVFFRLLDVLHQLVPRKILQMPTYLIEKYIYKRVDQIAAVTPKLANYAVQLGGREETTHFLPTASDSDLFYPQVKNSSLMKRLALRKNDYIILFSGYLYNFSGLDDIIIAFKKKCKNYSNFKFLIVGDGEQKKRLIDLIRKYDLESSVILTGFIKYEELPHYINLADVCINPFRINKITDIIFPSKIYQYLACGKPVIATPLKGVTDIFPDSDAEHGINYYNPQKPEQLLSLAEKIRNKKIIDKNQSLQDIAENIEKSLTCMVKEFKK